MSIADRDLQDREFGVAPSDTLKEMSGLEFLNQIKADAAFQEIPVVIISTEGKEEDTVRGLEAGAAAYIKKPFGNQELLEVIERHGNGPNKQREKLLGQIVGDWGRFEGAGMFQAGEKVEIDFVYRNAKDAELTLHALKIDEVAGLNDARPTR